MAKQEKPPAPVAGGWSDGKPEEVRLNETTKEVGVKAPPATAVLEEELGDAVDGLRAHHDGAELEETGDDPKEVARMRKFLRGEQAKAEKIALPKVQLPKKGYVRLYSIAFSLHLQVRDCYTKKEVAENGKTVETMIQKPQAFAFRNNRCDVPETMLQELIDDGRYDGFWGGGSDVCGWMSASDLAKLIEDSNPQGARFIERMYNKTVYCNRSGGRTSLQFAMEIHRELKAMGLL